MQLLQRRDDDDARQGSRLRLQARGRASWCRVKLDPNVYNLTIKDSLETRSRDSPRHRRGTPDARTVPLSPVSREDPKREDRLIRQLLSRVAVVASVVGRP